MFVLKNLILLLTKKFTMKKTLLFSVVLALTAIALNAQTPIGMADTIPTIDGVRDSLWDAAPKYLVVDPTSWSPNAGIKSDEDFSLSWSAMWDTVNLYFIFELMDDVVTIGDTAKEGGVAKVWMNDNVEVGIGPYGYRFCWGRDADPDTTNKDKNNPGGFTQVSMATTGGYNIEVMIPWATLSNDSVNIGEDPDIDSAFMSSIYGADLDNPDGWNWNELGGHLMWPFGWGSGPIVLAATAAIDDTAPAIPANLTVSNVTYKSADLLWDSVADTDFLGYMIYDSAAPFKYVMDTTGFAATLKAEETYKFIVKAFDGQNLSPASNVAEAITPAAPKPLDLEIAKYTGGLANPFEDFDVWDAQPKIKIERQATPGVDPSDHSAEFSAMWDDNKLYIVTYVMDDVLYNLSETEGWKNDAVEYHFDLNNERDGTSTDSQLPPWQEDNFQYRAIAKRPELQTGSTPAPDWTDVGMATWDMEDDQFNVVGFYIEASFPWSTLNASSKDSAHIVPAVDVAIGFDINSGDVDDDPEDRKALVWSSIQYSPHANTSEYGQLILKETVTSVDNLQAEESMISVYPNPTSGDLNVNLLEKAFENLNIIDMTGRTIRSMNIEGRTGTVSLNISDLSGGIYFVTVTNNGRSLQQARFIKK
jgi:hypothetical protein